MKLTIDRYIRNNYDILSAVNDYDNYWIEKIHNEVAERLSFKLPTKHILSHNTTSSIIHLNGSEYHQIIDYSVFHFVFRFLSALEYNHIDMARYTYFDLRRSICLSRGDYYHERIYRDITGAIPVTPGSYNKETQMMKDQKMKTKEFSTIAQSLISFYFFHEYGHFFIRNPVRKSNPKTLVDLLVNDFLFELKESSIKKSLEPDIYDFYGHHGINDLTFTDEFLTLVYLSELNTGPHLLDTDLEQSVFARNKLLNTLYDKSLADEYYQMYTTNNDVVEELICDNQSFLVMLEFVQFGYSIENIVKAMLALMYGQFAISLAKSIPNEQFNLKLIRLRMGVVIQFVKNLSDEPFSELITHLLNTNNRFNRIENLKCKKIDEEIYDKFLAVLLNIHSFDERKIFDRKSAYSVSEPIGQIPIWKRDIFSRPSDGS